MLVALTARKLKPGCYEDFVQAWGRGDDLEGRVRNIPSDGPSRRWQKAYTVRSVEDPDLIVSFGFFDGTREQLRASQEEMGYAAERSKGDEFVETVTLDGLFEVATELDWQKIGAAQQSG
jgi:hypothetical protein